jgi:methylaspartate mutase epsilon subunit
LGESPNPGGNRLLLMNTNGHVILLGGIGGDSHSVGLSILRQSLTARGYRLKFLGTQNTLEDFVRLSGFCNAVMISSLDGHARFYLQGFRDLLAKYKPGSTRWYLGGNLAIDDAFGCEKMFRDMGFDRVFVKFTDLRTVLETLEADLFGVPVAPDFPALWDNGSHAQIASQNVSDDPMPWDRFLHIRKEVLTQWPTAQEARDLRGNAEYLSKVPSYWSSQTAVHSGARRILVQPRCGVTLVNDQIRLFQVYKSAGADTLSYQVDSLTRNNNYARAAEAIRESEITGLPVTNGFPVINHGVSSLRRIMAESEIPIQTRHSTRSPELLAEISYAGGVSAFEGGAICYNIPYYKNYPLAEAIGRWQYVDRLTGYYSEQFNIILDREFFGVLTGTLIPPCIAITTNILESVLAVQQGVKCISVGYAEQGHRPQDIAAIRVMREKTTEVLSNLGYANVQINTVFHQYMAAFPTDPGRAEELVLQSAVTAAMSGATRLMVKTPVEAFRIPTVQDNIFALQLVRQGLHIGYAQDVNGNEVDAECAILRKEVDQLIEAVVLAGNGSIARGIVRAFELGLLEIPFSPSVYNRGEVVTARDENGAVRFLRTGKLPLSREIVEWHRSQLSGRRISEGYINEIDDYLLVEKDIMRLPRGEYDSWPLFA